MNNCTIEHENVKGRRCKITANRNCKRSPSRGSRSSSLHCIQVECTDSKLVKSFYEKSNAYEMCKKAKCAKAKKLRKSSKERCRKICEHRTNEPQTYVPRTNEPRTNEPQTNVHRIKEPRIIERRTNKPVTNEVTSDEDSDRQSLKNRSIAGSITSFGSERPSKSKVRKSRKDIDKNKKKKRRRSQTPIPQPEGGRRSTVEKEKKEKRRKSKTRTPTPNPSRRGTRIKKVNWSDGDDHSDNEVGKRKPDITRKTNHVPDRPPLKKKGDYGGDYGGGGGGGDFEDLKIEHDYDDYESEDECEEEECVCVCPEPESPDECDINKYKQTRVLGDGPCWPHNYPGYSPIPYKLVTCITRSGCYESICQLLRQGFRCADRILLMTPWGSFVVFYKCHMLKKYYFLYYGCIHDIDDIRYMDLNSGTAGLLCFKNLYRTISYIMDTNLFRTNYRRNVKQVLKEMFEQCGQPIGMETAC